MSSVETALSGSGLCPERLVLEITEGAALVESIAGSAVLEHLRNRGARLALDDFGTGYSSLSGLGRIRPDIIKIDPTFIGCLGADAYDGTVVQSIVSLGHELGAVIVAKGIETGEQFEHIRSFGCDLGQGHFFSPALPLGEIAKSVARVRRLFT